MTDIVQILRGELADCSCFAYSQGECSCDAIWPESACKAAADEIERLRALTKKQPRKKDRWEIAYYGDEQPHYIHVEGDSAKKVIDIRGWGYLTGCGDICLKLTEEEAIATQNHWAEFIVAAWNGEPLPAAPGATK